MKQRYCRCCFFLGGRLFTNFLFLLNSVQRASEMRASNTKTRKNKTTTKQSNCCQQASICYLFIYVFLLVFLFVFSLLYFAYSVQLVRICGNWELQRFSNTANYFHFFCDAARQAKWGLLQSKIWIISVPFWFWWEYSRG